MPDRCSNEPLSERHDSIFNKLLCIINSPSSSAFSKACASQLQDFRRENKIEFTVTDFSEISPNKNKGIGAVLNSYCKKGILTVVHFSGRHTVYSFSDRIEKKVPPSFSITQMASIRSCLEKLIATSKNESTHACCNRLISFLNEKKFLFTFNDLYIPSQDNHNKVSGLLSSLVFHHYLKIVGGTAKACEYSFDCPSDDFVLPFSSQQIAVITNKLDLYISSPRQSETKRIGQQLRNYLEVGQFFFCSKDLSDSLGLSVDKVRSSLGYLQSLKIVRRTSTSQTIKKESQEFSFDPSVSPIFTVKSTAQYSTEETQDKYLYRLLKHEEISKGVSNQLARLLIEYYRNGKESFSFYDISERLYIDHIKARKMLYNLLTAGYIKQYQRLVADHHFYVTYTYNTDEKLSSSPDQHQAFARAAYETFGNSEFSREMIIASVDYNENSLGAVLHDLTAMKILSCREDEETRYQYRFLVNPKDNPEYFATNTQQSFLADGKLSLLTDEKVPDGTQSFPPDEEAPNETVPDAEMLGAEGAAV